MPTYFITWTTYGTWLHGDKRGSVDPANNRRDAPPNAPDPTLEHIKARKMTDPPLVLSPVDRQIVERTIRAHCEIREWPIHALNVRTNHVHVVCSSGAAPEKVMGELKAWSSRRLRERNSALRKVWTRHGSTRWLDTESSFARAIEYVTDEQDGRGREQVNSRRAPGG